MPATTEAEFRRLEGMPSYGALRAENERLRGLLAEYMRLACSQAVTDEDWSDIIEETACAIGVPVPL